MVKVISSLISISSRPMHQCSRLTNFVGILSQGQRIAPPLPDASETGYLAFSFLCVCVQYLFTDRNDPIGPRLLSEVAALGELYELKKASVSQQSISHSDVRDKLASSVACVGLC
ncbi:hypothetical protein NE237_013352 [Protea cynaroides]|uniref:PARP catalytic domain-containing protein n=1 Tax=Protea cynaroides TaxID=273540 RepID=A0A9Q0JXS4_9MAGN|nr:hypothetical protein NE237_013352 [Protea cynaroides]